MKKLLSILSLFISILSVSAQETEWINGLGGNKSSIPYITCDSNGDIIMATSSSVAFTYRGFSVLNNAGQDNLILMKYNPKDSLLWLISTNVPASSTIKPLRVNTDNNNNIYILVQYFGGPIPLSPSISLVSSGANDRHAILKYSPNGTLIWKREFGRTDMDVYWTRGIKIFSDRLYFTSYYDTDNCNVSFEDAVDTFTVSKGAILSCYDTSGAFLYANTFDGLNVSNYSDIGVLNHNSIYFNGSVENKSIIGNDTVFSGIYIFNIDSNGLLLSKNYVVNNTNITYNRFTLLESGASLANIAWTFNAMDSLLFNDSVILTDNYNYPTSIVFNQNNKLKWHAHTTETSPSVFSPGGGVEDGGDGTFYIGGNLQGGTVNIKGIPLVYRSTAFDLCILKFDTKGNVLWGFTDGGFGVSIQVSSIASDKKGNFYVAGIFFNKIRLFNDSLLNKGIAESFIAKITDYSITRGEVSAGPYCAGDSMDIPYTKMGRYNPDNWFIAQLSDEIGNFDDTSKVRELGRLQATEDSTIRGALPLFRVSSSANYRIRVISTSPPVQSFYKRDSLRLLIYSMDKADPGPPETVCLGDSFQLHTYGGTVWEWSPKYLMDDSTSRTPTILAMKDTIFKIVISDTSGCGEPDTAFKRIFIRNNPKIVSNADTFYSCLNENFALDASFQDGDSAGYNWTWYNIPRANIWREIKSDSFAFVDTVYYTHNTSTRNIALVLNDGCSIKEDTAFYTIILHPSRAKGKISTLDSLQCDGSLVELFGNISGGDSATYSWEWFEIDEQNLPVFLDSGKGKFADTIGVQLD
ncbi:MAG: hypothetical protein LC109_00420 [Bacteroidia bacterium]|nr:hypothetical protein [Bacteroidia bacterium]